MSTTPVPGTQRAPTDLLDAAALPAVLPGVRRIAVLRANGLGDFMFALPALEALRAAYPQAEIVLLATPWHAVFYEGRPAPFDRVVVVPVTRGVREEVGREEDAGEVDRFFEEMSAERFDLAVQLHGGGRYSNAFVRRLGARVSAGLRTPDAPPLDIETPYLYFQAELGRYLEVAGSVGARPVSLEPHVTVIDRDRREAAEAIGALDGTRPLMVIHPGAGDRRRQWPPDRFARVADAATEAGLRVALVGEEREAPITGAVAVAMQSPPLDLAGRLSLGGLAGLFERSVLFLGNDSGPLHLARAVSVPTVGIYWCGNLITAGPTTRTWHRPVLSFRLDCPVCGVDCTKQQCGHSDSFVAEVPVDEVRDHVMDLLRLARAATLGDGTGVTVDALAAGGE